MIRSSVARCVTSASASAAMAGSTSAAAPSNAFASASRQRKISACWPSRSSLFKSSSGSRSSMAHLPRSPSRTSGRRASTAFRGNTSAHRSSRPVDSARMGVMAEFIVNPRRAPRAPARCRASVVSLQGWFEAETEDIGTMGCQIVSPKLVHKGDTMQLAVTNEKVSEPLKVTGRVAWVSPQAPWRVGIAFEEATLKECTRWFDLLVGAHPGLGGYRRVPDRIRADSTVYLGAPPKFLLDFSADEAMLLRAIASGARVDELMARLRDRWPVAQRALFSLIARQAVTFQRGQAVHPESWKKILTDIEASLAVEEMGRSGGGPILTPLPITPIRPSAPASVPTAPSRPVPVGSPGFVPAVSPYASSWPAAPAHAPTQPLELEPDDGSAPLEIEPTAPQGPLEPYARTPLPGHDFQGAGVGWRKARVRSPEAQAAFEEALRELQAGATNRALALLRRALALAPGDPEIASQLGRLAF